jgi:AcrR family transcriptional regulator
MSTTLRNPPVQARSRERLQRVLDAAEQVLAEEGAAALTTTRIAAVAGVPVASVYRFFPDREAIAEALALRYWSEFGDAVETLAEAMERRPLRDPVATMVDALAESFRSKPGFTALWFGGLRTERLRDATRPSRARFALYAERILAVGYPRADADLRRATARMLVLTGDALLREAFRVDPRGDAALLEETKFVLGAYLDARMGGRRR